MTNLMQDIAIIYPRVKVRNKSPFPQTIAYVGGDSVTIPGGQPATLKAAGLLQMPDPSVIEWVHPTLAMLIDDGIPVPSPAPSDGE